MFVQTQRLDYPDHKEEIQFLNSILAMLQSHDQPFDARYQPLVEAVIARTSHLMDCSRGRVSPYDPAEDHP